MSYSFLTYHLIPNTPKASRYKGHLNIRGILNTLEPSQLTRHVDSQGISTHRESSRKCFSLFSNNLFTPIGCIISANNTHIEINNFGIGTWKSTSQKFSNLWIPISWLINWFGLKICEMLKIGEVVRINRITKLGKKLRNQ